jgi:hypothetical protein
MKKFLIGALASLALAPSLSLAQSAAALSAATEAIGSAKTLATSSAFSTAQSAAKFGSIVNGAAYLNAQKRAADYPNTAASINSYVAGHTSLLKGKKLDDLKTERFAEGLLVLAAAGGYLNSSDKYVQSLNTFVRGGMLDSFAPKQHTKAMALLQTAKANLFAVKNLNAITVNAAVAAAFESIAGSKQAANVLSGKMLAACATGANSGVSAGKSALGFK